MNVNVKYMNSKIMDKRKGTCRKCKKEVNTEDIRRKYGSCSMVYMLSYCSAQCYTKDVTE